MATSGRSEHATVVHDRLPAVLAACSTSRRRKPRTGNRQPMRIFQILEFNQFNTGSVHQMFQAATGLRARGHEVMIVSRPDTTLEEKSRENGIEFAGVPLRNQFDAGSVMRLRELIRERRPDVIH